MTPGDHASEGIVFVWRFGRLTSTRSSSEQNELAEEQKAIEAIVFPRQMHVAPPAGEAKRGEELRDRGGPANAYYHR